MAGCKFWKPELFKQTQRIANEFVIKAFADQWKRVEVVQAFACMTYWKEPEDTVRCDLRSVDLSLTIDLEDLYLYWLCECLLGDKWCQL